ncbi:uncharacterized protein LOC8036676 isoform X1 [Ixodes scapularis]|uniref:uncharacterized protein LOC8036676 isoform X1 n=1 Tax=Ixodes scapularis TaxID=6945 RepID=UPI00116173F0|nr:uncharacterized protein LOC8036676 isoform X1 [Ixodes scapularis]
MTGIKAPPATEPLLPGLQTVLNFNDDIFQRELRELRESRLHTYAGTIFARSGLVPTMASRSSITMTGQNLSPVFEHAVRGESENSDQESPGTAPQLARAYTPDFMEFSLDPAAAPATSTVKDPKKSAKAKGGPSGTPDAFC